MKQIQDLYESTKNVDEVKKVVESTASEKQVEAEDATVRGGEGIDFELRYAIRLLLPSYSMLIFVVRIETSRSLIPGVKSANKL